MEKEENLYRALVCAARRRASTHVSQPAQCAHIVWNPIFECEKASRSNEVRHYQVLHVNFSTVHLEACSSLELNFWKMMCMHMAKGFNVLYAWNSHVHSLHFGLTEITVMCRVSSGFWNLFKNLHFLFTLIPNLSAWSGSVTMFVSFLGFM